MKYFIVSDIHSFYSKMKSALDAAGFDINNPEHTLIVNGDLFDRGEETLQLYDFIQSIPKNRRILIKGNHEELFFDLLDKDWPDSYDFSNGTVKTFCAIAGISELKKYDFYLYSKITNIWADVRQKVKKSSVLKFLKSSEWKDYYELNDKFIFVHSFIPTEFKEENSFYSSWPTYNADPESLKPVENWRTEATDLQWSDARWGCPWKQFKVGLFDEEIKNDKILVCGHWHASDFHINLENVEVEDFRTYKGDNLIAIDGCTAYSGLVNVMVVNENNCLSFYTNKPEQYYTIIETVPVKGENK